MSDTFLGVSFEQTLNADRYTGSAEALVAAGLVRREQLPGEHGRGKTLCTYYKDRPVRKGEHVQRDEHYLQVLRVGKQFRVVKGIPKREQQSRRETAQAQLAEQRIKADVEALGQMKPEVFRVLMADQVRKLVVLLGTNVDGEKQKVGPVYAYSLSRSAWRQILPKLVEVVEIIESSDLCAGPDLSLLRARGDASFQAFLASQCLKAE